MTFDPTSVEVTGVTLPKDHCVQVPWEYINVCGYSDQFCKNYHIHTHTYIHTYIHIHTTYRISDHIVSFWTTLRRDKNDWFYNFFHNFCEMGPSSKDWIFSPKWDPCLKIFWLKSNLFGWHIPVCLTMWVPPPRSIHTIFGVREPPVLCAISLLPSSSCSEPGLS